MTQPSPPPSTASFPGKFASRKKLIGFAAIGLTLGTLVGSFAYAGGWLSPHRLTPAAFSNAFEHIDGIHAGYRRNHAKGLCVSGWFESSGQAARVSKATVFRAGRTPVVGRFSFGGGMPNVVDAPGMVRGLGLEFAAEGGALWRTAMINLPVFPVRDPQAFYDRLLAVTPDPATGKPDAAKMPAFLAAHPESAAAMGILKGFRPSASFATTTFNSINAFDFTNAEGRTTPVKWSLVPEKPLTSSSEPPTTATSQPADTSPLFHGLLRDLDARPLRWHLILTLGQPGDPTADATLPWPADREQIDAGTLVLDHADSDDTSPTANLNFDPLILPPGISPSDDPLLSARSAAYAQSFTRRAREASDKTPSALSPADVTKGGSH